jgi:hypothetical protein
MRLSVACEALRPDGAGLQVVPEWKRAV